MASGVTNESHTRLGMINPDGVTRARGSDVERPKPSMTPGKTSLRMYAIACLCILHIELLKKTVTSGKRPDDNWRIDLVTAGKTDDSPERRRREQEGLATQLDSSMRKTLELSTHSLKDLYPQGIPRGAGG